MMAPASLSFFTTVAENGLEKSLRIAEAHVVGSSVVQILSLIAMACPSMGDKGFPVIKVSSTIAVPWV